MNMLDETIRHQQAVFKIKIFPILRRAVDYLFHKGHVFRMKTLKRKLNRRFRRSVVLEDSKGLLRPDNFTCGGYPTKASCLTEPLSFCKVRFATPLGALTGDENARGILQGNRSQ